MCYGVSQPAGARCCWMRRWRPWTTDFFNANLSLFHRDHVCTTHRLLHLPRLWGWHRVHRTIAGTAGHHKGRLTFVLDGFNAIFSLQQKTTNVGSSTSTSSTLLTFRTTSIYPSLPQRAMSVVSTFADGHGGEMNNMVFAKL